MTYDFDEDSGRLYQHGDGQTMFFPWPTMKAICRTADGSQPRKARPTLDLRMLQADPALTRYIDAIPSDVVEAVGRFPHRHWELLVFAARCGDAAVDLLNANPAIGYMLASNREFVRVHLTAPMVSARLQLMLGRRQRHLLEWLGFPPTEVVRRIMRKIEYAALDIAALRSLRAHIVDVACQKRLSHLPRITRPVLRLAADGTIPSIAPRLLRALVEGQVPRAAAFPRLVADTVRMWRLATPEVALPVFFGARRIEDVHHRLATTVNWLELSGSRGDLPTAPFPGTATIVPIDSVAMLTQEGVDQCNCVGSYIGQVKRRRLFVYRVLEPSRATLAIVRRDGRWRVDQLEAATHAPVPRETQQAVLAWLYAVQLKT